MRRVLVLGASRGIGRACAETFAHHGDAVVLVARTYSTLMSTADSINRNAVEKARVLVGDAADRVSLCKVIELEIANEGGFDIVVLNTGGPPSGPILGLTYDEIEDAMRSHCGAFHEITRLVTPSMKQRGIGRIVVVGSTSMRLPMENMALSNVIRGWIAGWVKTMSRELAPHGITVNAVMPGKIKTERMANVNRRPHESLTEMHARLAKQIPLGRVGEAVEVANVVRFLASSEASYVTGTGLAVDGGSLGIL